jgi:hypothetical protein
MTADRKTVLQYSENSQTKDVAVACKSTVKK